VATARVGTTRSSAIGTTEARFADAGAVVAGTPAGAVVGAFHRCAGDARPTLVTKAFGILCAVAMETAPGAQTLVAAEPDVTVMAPASTRHAITITVAIPWATSGGTSINSLAAICSVEALVAHAVPLHALPVA